MRTRGWNRTIRLKDLLSEDGSDENVKRVAAAVSARLMRLSEYEEDGIDEFSSAVDELRDIARSDGTGYDGRWTLCRHFNDVLDAIYDWADAERVWIA